MTVIITAPGQLSKRKTLPTVSCEDGCGICCMHMSAPPYDEEEIELLKENLPIVYADYIAVVETRRLQFKVVGTDFIPCGFFDMVKRTCRHHEHNPDVCHRFEVGGTYCRELRKDAGI